MNYFSYSVTVPDKIPPPGQTPSRRSEIRLSQDQDEAAAGVFTSPGLTLPRPTLARKFNAGHYGLLPTPIPILVPMPL